MSENEEKCPLCSDVLNEFPKGSTILFVCQKCGFKFLTIKELFSSVFWSKFQIPPSFLGRIESQAKVQ